MEGVKQEREEKREEKRQNKGLGAVDLPNETQDSRHRTAQRGWNQTPPPHQRTSVPHGTVKRRVEGRQGTRQRKIHNSCMKPSGLGDHLQTHTHIKVTHVAPTPTLITRAQNGQDRKGSVLLGTTARGEVL